jgi:hypothetical protein
MKRTLPILCAIIFLLLTVSCLAGQSPTPTTAAPTLTPQPTIAPTNTLTITIPPTRTATRTPRPTRTPTLTPTATADFLLGYGIFFSADETIELPPGSASTHRYIYAQTDPAPLNTSLATLYTVLKGEISITWASNIPTSLDFNQLSAFWSQVYDQNNVLLAEGPVTAYPREKFGVASTQGDVVHYDFSGYGSASFDASANGLDNNNQWESYAALLRSNTSYHIALRNAAVTVGEQTYEGELTLVIPAPDACPPDAESTCSFVTLSGAGQVLTSDFAGQASFLLLNADVVVGPSSVIHGTQPNTNLSNPYALIGYTGWLTLTEYTADQNQVDLDGTPEFDFGLQLVPSSDTIPASQTTSFQAQIFTSLSGDYTIDVIPPNNWQAEISENGLVTIQPAINAVPGVYTVTVLTSPNPPYELETGTEVEKIDARTSAIYRVTIYSNNSLMLYDSASAAGGEIQTRPMADTEKNIFWLPNGLQLAFVRPRTKFRILK